MDARQTTLANPLGMDEDCRNCGLCSARERVVHGYGDVGADFLFVGEMPGERTDRTGVPFDGTDLWPVLSELGFTVEPHAEEPPLENAYLTYLTRCHHPDRGPAAEEVAACDPFLTADVRMLNPDVLVPIGDRALRTLAAEHTTKPPDDFDADADHAQEVRGRGFELVPSVDPAAWTDRQREALVETIRRILHREYRQTKGRRGREERERSDDAHQ